MGAPAAPERGASRTDARADWTVWGLDASVVVADPADLPLARRDVEHLRHLLSLQRRLHDLSASPRAQQALTRRNIFPDALTWLDIHGGSPELVDHWNARRAEAANRPAATEAEEEQPPRRRRRRRRRRFRPATGQ